MPQAYSNEVCFATQTPALAIGYAGGKQSVSSACIASTLFDAGYVAK